MIIYKIKFPNCKFYIGKTIFDLEHRKRQHKSDMKRDKDNKAVYNAIKKYGWDNLEWEVIDKAENEDDLSQKEIYWINHYNTFVHAENSMGYNMTLGGEGASGYKFSDEQKHNFSKMRTGESNGFYGKTHTEESKRKQSVSKLGKYEGENNPNYNNKWNDLQKQRISNINKGMLIGENNPSVIITEDIAKEIKIRLSKGESISNISNELFVSYDIVRNIKQLNCWRDLLPELNIKITNLKQKRTKLSIDKAKDIKKRLSCGENPSNIIKDLGVTKDNVFNIKYLKNYKDLLPELNDKIIQSY